MIGKKQFIDPVDGRFCSRVLLEKRVRSTTTSLVDFGGQEGSENEKRKSKEKVLRKKEGKSTKGERRG